MDKKYNNVIYDYGQGYIDLYERRSFDVGENKKIEKDLAKNMPFHLRMSSYEHVDELYESMSPIHGHMYIDAVHDAIAENAFNGLNFSPQDPFVNLYLFDECLNHPNIRDYISLLEFWLNEGCELLTKKHYDVIYHYYMEMLRDEFDEYSEDFGSREVLDENEFDENDDLVNTSFAAFYYSYEERIDFFDTNSRDVYFEQHDYMIETSSAIHEMKNERGVDELGYNTRFDHRMFDEFLEDN